MATDTDRLQKDIARLRGEIDQISGEVRLRLHLGAMDARTAFASVQKDLEHVGRDISQTTRHALDGALARLKQVAQTIKSAAAAADPKSER